MELTEQQKAILKAVFSSAHMGDIEKMLVESACGENKPQPPIFGAISRQNRTAPRNMTDVRMGTAYLTKPNC